MIAKTAAVIEQFEGEAENRGILNDRSVFTGQILEANKAGMQIAVHAVGDWAVEAVLDAYEKALEVYAPRRPPSQDRARQRLPGVAQR